MQRSTFRSIAGHRCSASFRLAWEYVSDDKNELVILTDGKKLRVHDIADDCVRTWMTFVREEKIQVVLPGEDSSLVQ
jgi:hypothetical protein